MMTNGAMVMPAARAAVAPTVADRAQDSEAVIVDFADMVGRFKPVHGVNNGPYAVTSGTEVLRRYHREAGFPFVRLHDVPLAHGAPYAADISAIFPCVEADPDDPRYYTFAKTDVVIAAIIKNGAQVIYRLGQSIELCEKYHANPPQDPDKWARVCVNIVRHYNAGWADGFHHGIRRWEIWNEPETTASWTGTQAQFFDLYARAAKALKAHDASLLIGGPSVTGPSAGIVKPFLAHCRAQKVPLDFFSWHCYASRPEDVINAAKQARQALDAGGFTRAKSYCTGWRQMREWEWRTCGTTARDAAVTEAMFTEFNGIRGMIFCAAVLMGLQDTPVDIANYYTGDMRPRWGLFDRYGFPHKVYDAFPAYNELYQTGNRVRVQNAPDAVIVQAGVSDDGRSAALMLAGPVQDSTVRTVTVALTNLPWQGPTRCEILRADMESELALVYEQALDAGQTLLQVPVKVRSLTVIKLGEAEGIYRGASPRRQPLC